LLAPYPRLESLFAPLCQCIRNGNLSGFDAALTSGEAEFVKRRIYLTLERGRDIALRNLFRKVFLAGGFEETKDGQPPIRRTRIPVTEFAAAMRVGSKIGAATRVDLDEVECFLANLIYKVSNGCVGSLTYQAHVGNVGIQKLSLANSVGDHQNLMKGYIARERGIVVLSKGGAFPGTGV
jgi:COP9 signalosome complex subunit 12